MSVSRVNTRTGRGVVGSSSTAWLTPPPLEGMTTGVDTGSLLLKKMTRRSGCEAGAAEFGIWNSDAGNLCDGGARWRGGRRTWRRERAVLVQQGKGALVYRCAACVVMHGAALVSTSIRQLLGFQAP